ncbi:uncharacterized protein LOC132742744 [Ruditapes philippinarum]|uniref:uncharacterized protein LOC132742744 n=1 Tax=Ruditapes philippinarum TaxID=129788 RepID=UPI00295B44D9|nr:uncharacterized protein LOC132742744 [Ruditapes philippinarum]
MKSLSKVSIKKEHEYTLDIEAGDKPLGACRGIINIRFRGNGKMGDEEEFAVAHFPDNFERGFITTFDVVEPKIDVIDEIEIRGGTMIGEKGWKIDRITTTNKKTGAKSVFPVFTNIKCDQTYKFRTNDVSLPQKSSNKGIFYLLG